MLVFSTHAFTEGDLLSCLWRGRWPFYFNSRLHGRRRPGTVIHASWSIFYFNSRLHGRRQFFSHIRHSASLFQLTPSRKATRSRATTMSKSEISTHAFTEGDMETRFKNQGIRTHFNSRLHGRRLQIQIIFAAKHFLFLLILSKFLILAFLFHLASLRFSLHPVIFPVRISLYFSVYLPFALETCTLCHNI